ncbi:MAG: DinB family protein [Reyranellaceae bacterium]
MPETVWAQFARYNRLANEALYAACEALPDEARRRDLGAFFRSVHGTLNHLLLGDRIWMTRFAGGEHVSTGLDSILFDHFAELRQARVDMDRRIEAFFGDLPAGFLGRTLRYVNNAGHATADPAAVIVPHFFNHQTHHRAQVHTLLSQLGQAAPVLDLHRILRPDPVAR